MQKRGDLEGLVKGLFSPAKILFVSVLSPTKQIESLSAPPVKQGRRSSFISFQQTSSGNLGVCPSGNLPPTSTLKIEYLGTRRDSCGSRPSAASEGA